MGALTQENIEKFVAAWYYALEYGWRYARDILPARLDRRVVVVDRWLYDLRDSPSPGSRAARFAERVLPRPDVVLLADAPDEVIHHRKPERTLADQSTQQQRYRALLRERPARHAELVVDTSGRAADNLCDAVAAIVSALHRVRRPGR